MANIPIQKKRKTPWWAWLIGLIVIGLLIWLLLDVVLDNDEDADDVAQPVATTQATTEPSAADNPVATPSASTLPLTDLAALAAAADPALTGRSVQLEGAEVRSVVGDRTFWVGPSAEEKILVVLDETVDPAGVEGLANVNEGQRIALTGDVRTMPPVDEARQMFDLSEQNSADLTGESIYLYADTVTVQS